jgi:hypothetical protein
MRIVKKGKLPVERASAFVKKWSSRVVCESCKSVLEFHANDIKTYCVPNKVKVICPMCTTIVEIEQGGLPMDVILYVGMVKNGHWQPIEIE